LQFLNPAVLAGLVAALIPLAVHLLHRGHSRPVPFSNISFLRKLHHSRMQRLRMRQWLLLLLRVLAIALIVCAFARPTYQGETSWGGSVVPAAAAVLVDQSYSTSYRLPSGTLAEQQRDQVDQLLSVFSPRDKLALIPFATSPREVLYAPPDLLRQRVGEFVPSQEATDLGPALLQAARHLANYPDLDSELYLFTDLARYNWDELPEQKALFAQTRVYIGAPELPERNNLYIEAVRFSPWMTSANGELALQADIRYDGSLPLRDQTLDLFVDGERVRRRAIDLTPQSKTQVDLRFTPRRTGRLSGHLELAEDDLPIDNRRYFAFDAPSTINALILGPQPASTYYPRRALSAATQSDPALRIRSGLLSNLVPDELAGIDVLLLCDLERLTREQASTVHNFVRAGGGLILFPAATADLKYYNQNLLPGLLPVLIKDALGTAADKSGFHILDSETTTHPLFAGLLGVANEDTPRFFSHFSLAAGNHLQALAYFDDGNIALATGWRGQGRTVLAAFPLSMEWNNLALRGLFAPLLHRLVRELSQAPDRYATYTVGQTAHRDLGDLPLDAALIAETPTGERLRLQPERIDERYRWKVPNLSEAGIWRLLDGERLIDSFPVNVDTREADMRTIGPETLERTFAAENLYFLENGEAQRLQVLGNRYGRELWREFLALALVLLLAELWLGRAPQSAAPKTEIA